MAYGELKVDSITFTDGGSDVTVSVSGLTKNPTFSGDIVVSGNISGITITGDSAGFGSVTGVTVTGTTANFVTVSGTTVTGDAAGFTSITGGTAGFTSITGGTAGFTTVTGTTVTGTTANFATVSGTAITGSTAGFTTVTGTTVTGTTANFNTVSGTTVTGGTGNFTSVSATTATITSGVFAAGTAAAPSVSVGTTDNGLYSPGTDQVALSTNGTGRLFVDSSGNIQVGTNTSLGDGAGTPTLSVRGTNAGINIGTLATDMANGQVGRLSFVAEDPRASSAVVRRLADIIALYTGSNTSLDTDLVFQTATGSTAASERLRITSDGKVGLGTSSPRSSLDLPTVDSVLTIAPSDGSQGLRLGVSRRANWGDGLIGRNLVGVSGSDNYATPNSSNGGYAGIELKYNGAINFYGASGSTTAGATVSPQARLAIDTAGRVGIGTTSPGAKLEVNGGEIYNVNGTITQYLSSGGGAAVIGTFSNTDWAVRTNNVERCRVDTSGRLLVGTSSARSVGVERQVQIEGTNAANSSLSITRNSNDAITAAPVFTFARTRGTSVGANTLVSSGDSLGFIVFAGADGTDTNSYGAWIAAEVDGTPGSNDMPGRLVFSTTADGASSPTERMRITNGGLTRLVTTNHALEITSSASGGTTYYLIDGRQGGAVGSVGSGTTAFRVYTNGNVVNTNNSYGAISDAKLKENIVDASSQWDDIKDLRVRKYNFIEGQTHTQIGVVAQEVETVSPGLVTESPDRDEEGNDLGTVTKSVNYSVLYMKAVKALQEAMERIETLEAKVAALESA